MSEQSSMKSWIPLVCALCTGCDDDLEFEFEEVDATEQNTAVVVTSAGVGLHMSTPAGTKVVVGPDNRLHAVYQDAGRIKYTSSTYGDVWTTPVIIGETQAHTPTIAVAADGTIGVAYRKGDGPAPLIHYMSKPQNGAWTAPFRVAANSSGSGWDLSLVVLGNTMHLAWSGLGPVLYYASFAANRTVPLPNAELWHPPFSSCGLTLRFQPAIAVSQRGASDTSPRVRVAYLERYDAENCGPQSYFALVVAERPAGGGPWISVHRNEFAGTSYLASSSLSHSAIPTTGDFYAAVSYGFSSGGWTELLYDNAWNTTPFRRTPLLFDASVVDVTAAIVESVPRFRYALSNLSQGADGHGPTSYRTGRWVDTSVTPTWVEGAPVPIHPSATNAEALFFRAAVDFYTRCVPAVYEQLVDDVSSISQELTMTLGKVPCL